MGIFGDKREEGNASLVFLIILILLLFDGDLFNHYGADVKK